MIKRSKTDSRNFQDIKPIVVKKKTQHDKKLTILERPNQEASKKWKKTKDWEPLW